MNLIRNRLLQKLLFITFIYSLLGCGSSANSNDPVTLSSSYYSDLYAWNE